MNLKGKTYHDNFIPGKVRSKQFFDFKLYTEAEQELINFIKNERNNIDFNYNFTYQENRYIKENGSYFVINKKQQKTEISKKEIDKQYDNYTKGILDDLG